MGKSIMALSETVKESLRDAQEDLRNALACAARTEKPFVSKHIADMLAQIDNLIDATEMLEKMKTVKMEIAVSLEHFLILTHNEVSSI